MNNFGDVIPLKPLY